MDGESQTADVLSGAGIGGRVVRGGTQRAAGFVAANLITLIGAVLLTRHLGVEDFGRFGTVMALLAIVQGVADAGLTMTGSRELALIDDRDRRRELLSHVLGLRVVLTAAGIAFAVLFAYVAGYDETLVAGTLIAGLGIFLISVQSAMLLPLAVEMRNGTIALNEVARQFVLVAGWAALVVAGAALLPFFAMQLAAGVVLLAITPLLLARHHFVAPRWNAEQIRSLAAIGLPVAFATVLGVVYLRLLVVLMSVVSDSETEIGYYVTSARVIEVFSALPVLLVTVVVPVLTVAARDDDARLRYVTARMTEAMALAGVLIAVVLAIGAEPVVVALAGEAYEPAADVVRIQCLALITIFVTSAFVPTLLGMGRVRELALATAVGLVALLAFGLALIPPLEATGAAIAAVAADVMLCAAAWAALRRAGPGRALDTRNLARIALAGLAAGAVAFVPGVPDAVLAVLAGAVFVAAVLALRVVPPELVGAMRARLGRVSAGGEDGGPPDTLTQ